MERIAVIEDEVEAQILDSILIERNIPHRMTTYRSYAYDGIFQAHMGWGHIGAPADNRQEILGILEDLRRGVTDPGEHTGPSGATA